MIPVEVVATSLTDGRERWFTYGPALDAVLASCAIPAIFPPVEIDGERYIDGAVVNNVPIRRAIDAGATRIVVLLCTPPVYTPQLPKRPVEAMLNALLISIHARFGREMAQLPPGVEVILCSGIEGGSRDFDDFSTTEALIAQGREEAAEVVRRYGLGAPRPGAPPTGPDGAGGSNGAGPPDRVPGSDGVDRPGVDPDGSGSVPFRPDGVAAPAHPSRPGQIAPHDPGGHAGDDAEVGERAPHHRAGPDHHVAPQLGPREHHHTGAEPAAGSDADGHVARPLRVHHLVGALVPVVLVGDVHVGTGVDIVPDVHLEVPDDVAPASDHAAVPDASPPGR